VFHRNDVGDRYCAKSSSQNLYINDFCLVHLHKYFEETCGIPRPPRKNDLARGRGGRAVLSPMGCGRALSLQDSACTGIDSPTAEERMRMERRGSWTGGSVERSNGPGSAESHGMRARSLLTGLSLYWSRQPDSRGADADGEERDLDMGEREAQQGDKRHGKICEH